MMANVGFEQEDLGLMGESDVHQGVQGPNRDTSQILTTESDGSHEDDEVDGDGDVQELREDHDDVLAGADEDAASLDLEELREAYDALLAERTTEKEAFVRQHADMQNLRRRLEKEKTDSVKFSLEQVLKDLLPCLDSFEQAMKKGKGQEGSLMEGVHLVYKQMMDVLARHGLGKVEAEDQAFDPEVHQAVRQETSEDVEHECVSEVYQNGYTLHQRLLRPAVVSVLCPDDKAAGAGEGESTP